MSQSAADRLALRQKSNRPMPSLNLAREGEPAVTIGKNKRSKDRPNVINTAISDEAYDLLERMTQLYRKQHGRSWRQNATLETALTKLAGELNLSPSNQT